MANPAVDHYLAEFSALRAELPGHGLDWLQRSRKDALDAFACAGFPTPRHEDWKYTRVTPIEKRRFKFPERNGIDLRSRDLERFHIGSLECEQLVFVDGRYVDALSRRNVVESGARITTLESAMNASSQLLESHLGRYAATAGQPFSALNAAFMSDGAVIHVKSRSAGEPPIHLLFIATSEEVVAHPRILVIAEAGSQTTVIESYASLVDACYFTNALTEIVLMEEARVDHYKLQEESVKAFHVATLEVRQDRDSRFASHSISFGGQLVRNDINVLLDADGAACTLNGLFMAAGRQHVDYHTRIDHAKPNGTSVENYKGILDGRARGVFNGRVKVHPDAQKTDAHQSNQNLLLSRDAEIDTKPELEIYADDVKCSHGATVGQLDEHTLYYLRSRGIGETQARALLTYGFARDILERVDLAPLKQKLADELLQRMPNAEQIREMVQ
ncbi:MAG: Fe-S cluster assembly protein SufD [Gammaproteobacteria bacterium]|nr:MAG: Fe-S cluster assembly protein SufD [Gammaproteobacteria bacterium]